MTSFASLFKPASILLLGSSNLKHEDEIYKKQFELLRRNLENRAFTVDLAKDLKKAKIPKKIDLAILSLPERLVGGVMKALLSRRVRYLLIAGELSREAEDRLKTLARRKGITVIGPGSAPGIICPEFGTAVTTLSEPLPQHGPVSVICQNQAFCNLILKSSVKRGVGISKFICMGKSGSGLYLEMIKHLSADEKTHAMCLELSEFNRTILETMKKITAVKPVVVMYTGAEDPILASALKQVGVVHTGNAEHLLTLGSAVYLAPPMTGDRVVLITNAPETTELARHIMKNFGLVPTSPPEETRDKIARRLSVGEDGAVIIPSGADEDTLKYALKELAQNGGDAVLMILNPEMLSISLEKLYNSIEKVEKPVIGALIGSERPVLPKRPRGIILLPTIEEAIEAMRGCLIFTKNIARAA